LPPGRVGLKAARSAGIAMNDLYELAPDLTRMDLNVARVLRNAPPAVLYEAALGDADGAVASTGALVASSGAKTGRSPKDKRIVAHPDSAGDIAWGDVNIRLDDADFLAHRRRAIDYLNTRDRLFIVDGYAGWDPRWRIKVRVICTRAYHALFMHNMLIRPTAEELAAFGEPDYVILNAGPFPADRALTGGQSTTAIALSFERRELVILGTEYAGEMKKGVFTIMHYLLPRAGVLSMHCAANEGPAGDVSLFFGLSGTGKTTLSADPRRRLIGDDEHGWSDAGVFNIEGGCYAKTIRLSPKHEPDIHRAIRFGCVLENVAYHARTREVDYDDDARTENTRAAYPIEYIPSSKVPCVGGHPRNIIFLTCDAFGVLPPVSRLTPDQAMCHFLSGYTARVAGTEMGVREPQVAFSACFSAAFLVWRPTKYAELLARRVRQHDARVWLVNTGWSGGGYGVGTRIKLPHTRAIIDAIHAGALDEMATIQDPHFDLAVPTACPGVPRDILQPCNAWNDPSAYDSAAHKLAALFRANLSRFADDAGPALAAMAPGALAVAH
jgi:phosphoenolpyruvate carboxykinase (ATP)